METLKKSWRHLRRVRDTGKGWIHWRRVRDILRVGDTEKEEELDTLNKGWRHWRRVRDTGKGLDTLG